MRDATPILIAEHASLLEALEQLEATAERLLICVDKEQRLCGVLSDGDVRRGLLESRSLQGQVRDFMNPAPLRASDQASRDEIRALLSRRILAVPVVDQAGVVIGYHSAATSDDLLNVRSRSVAVVGLGYVGTTLAVGLARAGFRVKGVDSDPGLVGTLRAGRAPFHESGLQHQLAAALGRGLSVHTALDDARADIYLVAVGTPLDPISRRPDLRSVESAARAIGRVLVRGNLVVLRSTVPVGCTRSTVIPALEAESGLRCGPDFHVAFAAERTVEGRALVELASNPQLVAGFDRTSAELTARLFHGLSATVVDAGSLEAAELGKLLDNCYRDHVFAFSNMLAPLAERLGLDLPALIDAVNFGYARNQIPKPSPGVGGPCLSKDPYLLRHVFESVGLEAPLLQHSRAVNEAGPLHLRDKLARLLGEVGKELARAEIALVGLAFKGRPETSDLRQSTSLAFLDALPERAHVRAYDPVVEAIEIAKLGVRAVNLDDAFCGADAVVVLNNHPSYGDWDLARLLATARTPAVFLDTWHLFDPRSVKQLPGIRYGGLGHD